MLKPLPYVAHADRYIFIHVADRHACSTLETAYGEYQAFTLRPSSGSLGTLNSPRLSVHYSNVEFHDAIIGA
jgi:hypothetical protein